MPVSNHCTKYTLQCSFSIGCYIVVYLQQPTSCRSLLERESVVSVDWDNYRVGEWAG